MKKFKFGIILFIVIGVYQHVNAQVHKMENKMIEPEPKIKEVEPTEYVPVKEHEIKAEPHVDIASPAPSIEHAEYIPVKEPEIKAEPRQPEAVKPVANTIPEKDAVKPVPVTAHKSMPVFQKVKPTPMKKEVLKPVFTDPAKK